MEQNEENGEGKGRATRSRKAAESARRERLKPARGSKAAKAQSRQRDWQQRIATRRAMYTNDEKNLPIRDRGEQRRFIRNFVDRQLSIGELFVPAAGVVMILLLIPNKSIQAASVILWYVMFLGLGVDGVFLAFRIRRALRQEFAEESHRGAVSYALMRSLTFRPMRLPRPLVKLGGGPAKVKLPKSLTEK